MSKLPKTITRHGHTYRLADDGVKQPYEFLNTDGEVVVSGYFHINNGGAGIRVISSPRFGPIVEVKSSHFGNNVHFMQLLVDVDSLRKLGEMFLEAADAEYSDPYVDHTSMERDESE